MRGANHITFRDLMRKPRNEALFEQNLIIFRAVTRGRNAYFRHYHFAFSEVDPSFLSLQSCVAETTKPPPTPPLWQPKTIQSSNYCIASTTELHTLTHTHRRLCTHIPTIRGWFLHTHTHTKLHLGRTLLACLSLMVINYFCCTMRAMQAAATAAHLSDWSHPTLLPRWTADVWVSVLLLYMFACGTGCL